MNAAYPEGRISCRLAFDPIEKTTLGRFDLRVVGSCFYLSAPGLALDALRTNATAPRCSKRTSSINVFIK